MSEEDDPVFRMLRRRLDAGEMTREEYEKRCKSFAVLADALGCKRWALLGKLYEPPSVDVDAVIAFLANVPDVPPDPGDEMP